VMDSFNSLCEIRFCARQESDPTVQLSILYVRFKEYTLAPGGTKTFENQVVDIVEIVPNATTGAWYLDAGLVDIWLFKKVTGA